MPSPKSTFGWSELMGIDFSSTKSGSFCKQTTLISFRY